MAPTNSWHEIITREPFEHFAEAFTEDVTFETSTCNRKISGPADLRTLMRAMSSLYERLTFTSEVDAGSTTFLLWEALTKRTEIAGVTVIERDPTGRIKSIHLHQRRLQAIVLYASELKELDLPGFAPIDFAVDADTSKVSQQA